MKTLLLICITGWQMLFTNPPVHAQDTVATYRRPTLFKTNLLGPFSLLVEGRVAPRKSVQLGVQRVNFGLLGTDNKFFSLTSEFKFYLSRRASTERRPYPKGFYLSPYLKYRNVREVSESWLFCTNCGNRISEFSYNMLGGGAIAGAQVIFRKGFTLDAFLGGGYFPLMGYKSVYIAPNTYDDADREVYRIDIRVGFCLGYAFKPAPLPK